MSGVHISTVKMYGAFTATLLTLFWTPLQAIPSKVTSNDVYPETIDPSTSYLLPTGELPPKVQSFSLDVARNMGQVTDLREFIMKYVQDQRICHSKSMRSLILGDGESDPEANIWWARRCGRRTSSFKQTNRNLPESTLIRYRRKSSNRDSSQQSLSISKKDQKKLQALLKNKKIKCNPKKAVVELPNEESHLTILKPSCVYIKQCGGCCDSPHLECRPTGNKTRKFKVLELRKMEKPGALEFSNRQVLKTIKVTEHTSCQCECKEREEHCSPNQKYDPDSCRCYCSPEIDRNCSVGKVWDEKRCECVCSDVSECTTGRYFDTDICRCADPPR
ncbi:vascular endothelial growth factor C-like isoform X1 [Macrobrachium rosenbergii]|uniref:vascular endothelial growth factor C-like isoform X1 n=1 Tax=Macrobrachium rosenbergii TaxID=79674 RepID=UPI0034D64768